MVLENWFEYLEMDMMRNRRKKREVWWTRNGKLFIWLAGIKKKKKISQPFERRVTGLAVQVFFVQTPTRKRSVVSSGSGAGGKRRNLVGLIGSRSQIPLPDSTWVFVSFLGIVQKKQLIFHVINWITLTVDILFNSWVRNIVVWKGL